MDLVQTKVSLSLNCKLDHILKYHHQIYDQIPLKLVAFPSALKILCVVPLNYQFIYYIMSVTTISMNAVKQNVNKNKIITYHLSN